MSDTKVRHVAFLRADLTWLSSANTSALQHINTRGHLVLSRKRNTAVLHEQCPLCRLAVRAHCAKLSSAFMCLLLESSSKRVTGSLLPVLSNRKHLPHARRQVLILLVVEDGALDPLLRGHAARQRLCHPAA